MKVGDLVRARIDLDDNQGFVKEGVVGIVTKLTQPTPDVAMGTAVIKFPPVNVHNLSLARVGGHK